MPVEYSAHPYGAKVVFAQTVEEQKQLCKHYKVECFKHIAGCTLQVDELIPMTLVMVVLDQDLATLVHECAHAAMMILQSVGIKPSSAHGEVFCYLLDNMFTSLRVGFIEA